MNQAERPVFVMNSTVSVLNITMTTAPVQPFLFLDDPRLALRVSNAILLGLLFLVGWRAAHQTLAKPWLGGVTFLLVGVLLVALAIPLGG